MLVVAEHWLVGQLAACSCKTGLWHAIAHARVTKTMSGKMQRTFAEQQRLETGCTCKAGYAGQLNSGL